MDNGEWGLSFPTTNYSRVLLSGCTELGARDAREVEVLPTDQGDSRGESAFGAGGAKFAETSSRNSTTEGGGNMAVVTGGGGLAGGSGSW